MREFFWTDVGILSLHLKAGTVKPQAPGGWISRRPADLIPVPRQTVMTTSEQEKPGWPGLGCGVWREPPPGGEGPRGTGNLGFGSKIPVESAAPGIIGRSRGADMSLGTELASGQPELHTAVMRVGPPEPHTCLCHSLLAPQAAPVSWSLGLPV